jgi:hypothetical protein
MAAIAAIVPAAVMPVATTAITALFDHTKTAVTAIFDHIAAAIGAAIDAICGAFTALPIEPVSDTVSAALDRVGTALSAATGRFGGALAAALRAALDRFGAAFGSGDGAILALHVFGPGILFCVALGAAHHIGAETALVGTLLDTFGAFSPFRTRRRGNALLLLRPGLLLRLLARRAGIAAHLLTLGTGIAADLLTLGAGAFTALGFGGGRGHCQGKHKGKSRKRAALGKQGVGHKGLQCRPPTTSG